MGKYPVDAVSMLAKIAAEIEPHRPSYRVREELKECGLDCEVSLNDLIALSVETIVETVSPVAVVVPSLSGASARSISRYRLSMWIAAVSAKESTCQQLQFSYGVYPVHMPEQPEDWNAFARDWVRAYELDGSLAVLTGGPSPKHPEASHRIEIIELKRK
jgi:pyruvate kinase